MIELDCAYSEFETRLSKVDSLQESIEMLLDSAEMDDDLCKAAEVRERAHPRPYKPGTVLRPNYRDRATGL